MNRCSCKTDLVDCKPSVLNILTKPAEWLKMAE
jgi:hypothetical protein